MKVGSRNWCVAERSWGQELDSTMPNFYRDWRGKGQLELTTVAGAPVKYDVYACLEIARRLTQPLLSGFACSGNADLGFRSAKWVR